ncbi:MAG: LysE family transporter [Bacteroidales bacterium]|jgi:threonine/homoserine/homoserine lactone efflux protein|nr:LysE family transporter [Bacteroidales bacterium]
MGNTSGIFEKLPEFSRIWSFSFVIWAVVIGLFLSLIVNMGPAFITLVQTSLHRGFRTAAWFISGVILNDAMIISLYILTSVQVVMRSELEVTLFSIGAGVILVLFGIFTFRRKVEEKESLIEKRTNEILEKKEDKPSWLLMLGKGFVINLLNPFVWIFWFSAVAVVAGSMGGRKVNTIVFFAIILGTTLTLELLKAWGAAKLKVFFNPKRTTIMNRCAGILLVVCGIYFIFLKGIVNLL